MGIKSWLRGFLLLLFTGSVCAQSFSTANFALNSNTRFDTDADKVVSTAAGSFAGRFVPIHEIRIQAAVTLDLPDTISFFHALPALRSTGELIFDGASISSPFILGSDFSLSAFTGLYDDPSSGSLLSELLKAALDPPEFHGMPAGHYFSAETEIRGTGIALTMVPGTSGFAIGSYACWNSQTGEESAVRGDLRVGYAGPLFTLNSFAGINWLHNRERYSMRGGLSILLSHGDVYALYTSAGILDLTPGTGNPEKNLYFVFEPRMSWYSSNLTLSFFSSPVLATGRNYLGANALFSVGKLDRDKMRAGISILGSFDSQKPGEITPFSFSASPFYSLMFGDMLFDITAVVKPLQFRHPASAIELQLGMKAVY
ncbi:MAG: hypothetical protein EWM51_05360 [Treponema sp.]|nr:MAG: hypothetical protein EWM51_05360 [Treponema sp.]